MQKPRLFVASVVVMCVAIFSGGAYARDPLTQPVILVATPELRGETYAGSVLIVTPIGAGQHIGLIINRPTPMRLSQMFPDHEPSRKVTEPVFLGGPENLEVLFVLVQRQRNEGANAIELTPGLYLEMERKNVDHAIENEHERARFFGRVRVAPEVTSGGEPAAMHEQLADGDLVLVAAGGALQRRRQIIGKLVKPRFDRRRA